MKNINVFGYATFGTPNGFTQSCIYGNKSLEKLLKTFDLKTNAIQLLSANDYIFSIRKESTQNNTFLSYSVYTYAKEKNSNRSGTFVGTSLVFVDETIAENLIFTSLSSIHSQLKKNNIGINNTLNINHSKDFNIQNVFSKDFEKLEYQTTKFNFLDWENSGKNLVVFTNRFDQNEIQNLFKKSLQLLPKYDTIYFIDSNEIAEFVSQKRLFRLTDKDGLEKEIQILQEERKQKITNAISKFEKEKEKLDEERKKVDENLKKQLEQNKQKHSENQEEINKSENDLNKLNIVYQNFLKKYDELINGLNADKTLEEINNSYAEYKRNFEEEKKKLDTVSYLQSFQNPRINTHSSQNRPPNYNHHYDDDIKEDTVDNKVYIVLIVSVILNILLIVAALVYYFMFFEKQQEQYENINQEEPINNEEIISDSSQTKLNPVPDTILMANDYKLVAKQLERNMKIKDVVKVIFDKNKTEIKDFYQNQKEDYTKLLIEKNSASFNTVDSLFTGDSIKVIPSKKSNK